MSPRPAVSAPRAQPRLLTWRRLVGVSLVLVAAFYLADEGRRHRLRMALEDWVADLQVRFGIGTRRYPGAADVEVLKPPMALRNAAPEAPAPTAAPAPAAAGATPAAAPASVTVLTSPARGQQGSDIPLQIALRDAARPEALLLVIGGLPMDASLSAGERDDKGRWLLPADRLEGLTLRAATSGSMTLLIRTRPRGPGADPGGPDAALEVAVLPPPPPPAAAPTADLVGAPPAPPPPPPAPAAETRPAPTDLLDNARRAFGLGDVAAARLYLEAAAAQGDGAAMLELAASYDPVRLGERGPGGIEPEPLRAAEWYLKARQAGLADADAGLAALRDWLARHPDFDTTQRAQLENLLNRPREH
ncbi:hypothetical protein EV699_11874 [Plasticicumulans lactativorans]|uniref:Uncharacterized protein n=1 Tax=Plasticicumulans lactativorans TaxID=1133106 RepID=A0A4R2LA88_9GAMM|nr:hypothetical protein [Plasticicumulans lactativorans]TCO79688.1 hypothetical protein EV699_11874 [Plasticicumulans lactativorans]